MGITDEIAKAFMTEDQRKLAEQLKTEFVKAGSQKISDPAVKTAFNRYADVEYQLMQENLSKFAAVVTISKPLEAYAQVLETTTEILRENKTEFETRLRKEGVVMEEFSEEQQDQFQNAYQVGLEHVRNRVLSPKP